METLPEKVKELLRSRKFWTVEALADALDCPPDPILEAVNRGEIPADRDEGPDAEPWRIRGVDLIQALLDTPSLRQWLLPGEDDEREISFGTYHLQDRMVSEKQTEGPGPETTQQLRDIVHRAKKKPEDGMSD